MNNLHNSTRNPYPPGRAAAAEAPPLPFYYGMSFTVEWDDDVIVGVKQYANFPAKRSRCLKHCIPTEMHKPWQYHVNMSLDGIPCRIAILDDLLEFGNDGYPKNGIPGTFIAE